MAINPHQFWNLFEMNFSILISELVHLIIELSQNVFEASKLLLQTFITFQ